VCSRRSTRNVFIINQNRKCKRDWRKNKRNTPNLTHVHVPVLVLLLVCCLVWLMDSSGYSLRSGPGMNRRQTSNAFFAGKCSNWWKSRRKCRKVSNHCECDVSSDKHAIYLLPINGQNDNNNINNTKTNTTGSENVLGNRSKPPSKPMSWRSPKPNRPLH